MGLFDKFNLNKNINKFLNIVLEKNNSKFRQLIFNLYEDEEHYSMDACYDEDNFVLIDNPVILYKKDKDYKAILSMIKEKLEIFYKNNENSFKNIKIFAYGFVDGDLYYIKNDKKKSPSLNNITYEDLKKFDLVKLYAWLSVYLKKDVKDKNPRPFMSDFIKMPSDEIDKWIRLLVDNFDYDKYNKN